MIKIGNVPSYHGQKNTVISTILSLYSDPFPNFIITDLYNFFRFCSTIAAGFSNGYIALWDLTYKSPLSIQKRKNTYFINAFQHFYAHGNAVSSKYIHIYISFFLQSNIK